MDFSPYQSKIFDFIEAGKGSAIVIAVAGAGKTTTAIEGISRMSGNVIVPNTSKRGSN